MGDEEGAKDEEMIPLDVDPILSNSTRMFVDVHGGGVEDDESGYSAYTSGSSTSSSESSAVDSVYSNGGNELALDIVHSVSEERETSNKAEEEHDDILLSVEQNRRALVASETANDRTSESNADSIKNLSSSFPQLEKSEQIHVLSGVPIPQSEGDDEVTKSGSKKKNTLVDKKAETDQTKKRSPQSQSQSHRGSFALSYSSSMSVPPSDAETDVISNTYKSSLKKFDKAQRGRSNVTGRRSRSNSRTRRRQGSIDRGSSHSRSRRGSSHSRTRRERSHSGSRRGRSHSRSFSPSEHNESRSVSSGRNRRSRPGGYLRPNDRSGHSRSHRYPEGKTQSVRNLLAPFLNPKQARDSSIPKSSNRSTQTSSTYSSNRRTSSITTTSSQKSTETTRQDLNAPAPKSSNRSTQTSSTYSPNRRTSITTSEIHDKTARQALDDSIPKSSNRSNGTSRPYSSNRRTSSTATSSSQINDETARQALDHSIPKSSNRSNRTNTSNRRTSSTAASSSQINDETARQALDDSIPKSSNRSNRTNTSNRRTSSTAASSSQINDETARQALDDSIPKSSNRSNRTNRSNRRTSSTATSSSQINDETARQALDHSIPKSSTRSIRTSTTNSSNRRTSSITTNSSQTSLESTRRVSWKSDPLASFSDWTLEVSFKDGVHHHPRVDVYRLHKNMIAFGLRKSGCILRQITELELQQVILNSSSNHVHSTELKLNATTKIFLPTESQARVVPLVLDFLYYTKEIKQKMTAETSCYIFKVAEVLEIDALQKVIGEFYMKNLTLKNLGNFLTSATKTNADKLLTICKAKIGQMITEQPELSGMVPPKFMADILWISSKQLEEARLREPEKYTEELVISQSLYWSKVACICAAANESILTPSLFEKLTAPGNLPYIDVSATPKLLSIESHFLGTEDILERSSGHMDDDSNGALKPRRVASRLTSLQQRCVDSIANDLTAFQECFESEDDLAESLRHLPSSILAEILMKSRLQNH